MKALQFVLLALLLLGCAANRNRSSRPEMDAIYRNGLDRLDAGDYRTALRRFHSVRDADPKYPGLMHHLGICYAKLGLPALAVEALRLAAANDPRSADVKLDLAVALDLSASPREAEGVYLELLEAHPTDARAVLNLGLLYVRRLRDPEKARVQILRYLEMHPDSLDADELRRWLETHPPEGSVPEAKDGTVPEAEEGTTPQMKQGATPRARESATPQEIQRTDQDARDAASPEANEGGAAEVEKVPVAPGGKTAASVKQGKSRSN